MKIGKLISVGIVFMQLLSCASKPSTLGMGARAIMVQKNEALFRNRAIEFMENVQAGRLDRLIQQTSALTISNSGEKEVRKIYADQIIPSFREVKIHWNKEHKIVYDEYSNVGLTFWGNASGRKSFPFYLDVFGEHGRLVIMNIRTTPRQ